MKSIHILDYGVGNIGSLSALLHSLGVASLCTSDPAVIKQCPMLILPGVGSATTALRELDQRQLFEPLLARHAKELPIIGICLGAQLLFSFLDEAPGEGLGFFEGTVARLESRTSKQFNTGWCPLEMAPLKKIGFATGLLPSDTFFFNHQYVCPPPTDGHLVTIQGDPKIPALMLRGHLCGIQFHPEKSQAQGRRLMRNILRSFHAL